MVVRLRLARFGAKNLPFYRLVAIDSRKPRQGRHLEMLGTYNPIYRTDGGKEVRLNFERIKYWLGVGAQPSDRVAKILGISGILPKPPVKFGKYVPAVPPPVKMADELEKAEVDHVRLVRKNSRTYERTVEFSKFLEEALSPGLPSLFELESVGEPEEGSVLDQEGNGSASGSDLEEEDELGELGDSASEGSESEGESGSESDR
eukprot:GILJ01003289.1.p1 GENE.GILJ01003289.1~~GILJ01003289.1.p1  ORF type:complete len:217 (-),score=17.73 GILJ01003289.1:171-782(-)